MADEKTRTQMVTAEKLVGLLENGIERVLVIDSRSFVEYNASHILDAVNINCSKLMKRRLQQDKVQIIELIQHSAKQKIVFDNEQEVVVYDQCTQDVSAISSDCFLSVLLSKLEKSFNNVSLLIGGFATFSSSFSGLCEGKSTLVPTSISQPCLPVTNTGPTRILPHLYLGCQRDVLDKELMQQIDIGYVLNASNTCPKPDFIPESHFLRVPVNDSFCEKILPWLDKSVEFIEKAKASNGCVLVHCLAGISRSATIAIAYIMKRMDMSLDEAYRFVKEKRPTISPNFNFLGQLLDFEKKLKTQTGQTGTITKLKFLQLERPGEQRMTQDSGYFDTVTENQAFISTTSETMDQNPTAPITPLSALMESTVSTLEEEHFLAQGINGLSLSLDRLEDNNRLKRSFSLDIKSVSYPISASGGANSAPIAASAEDSCDPLKESNAGESSRFCFFSSAQKEVEQLSEHTTPIVVEVNTKQPQTIWEQGTPKSAAIPSAQTASSTNTMPRTLLYPLHRSGSMEDNYRTNFLLGLSSSQQHLATSAAGMGLKGWHSDILSPQTSTASLANTWYFATEALAGQSPQFLSSSTLFGGATAYSAFSCSQLPSGCDQSGTVRRREKHCDRRDSRRSWHEESPYEKQYKRRSCQMEFEEGMNESRSREDLGKIGSQSSFSGSMEIIEVS
ncbi:dual specificity protein phosphatase 16 [Carcharodon carcharias]|uniref:dual specificity protein phosphatase 16 n=1 Tax=Carcharodon carcharias TaxID=13397 RepID=UPI001B7F6A2E|nr:dual specificity protein phosphatase 16 [Carcharodon carcharias]XP_041071841.1 dual specificity protein phosphatase 16 [Carcharodon carcharias]XP_041071842.1 dual specificity protein phosphatase 16 [Carcharodon carcharias]